MTDHLDTLRGSLRILFKTCGYEWSAEKAGKSDSSLQKRVHPERPQQPNMQACLTVETAAVAAGLFTAETAPVCGMWRRQLMRATNQGGQLKTVIQESIEVSAAAGSLANEVRKAIEDGHLSPDEKVIIRENIRWLYKELDDLARSLDISKVLPD